MGANCEMKDFFESKMILNSGYKQYYSEKLFIIIKNVKRKMCETAFIW